MKLDKVLSPVVNRTSTLYLGLNLSKKL